MTECSECDFPLPLKVLKSAAGYYIGYFCPNCGPYNRITGYYKTSEEAQKVLEEMDDD